MVVPRRPVVGCFPLYPPVELVHAMGATPVVLWQVGGPASTPLADRHVQPFACGIARQLVERVRAEGRQGFDAVLSYNACDTLRNLPELVAGDMPSIKLHVPQAGLDAPHGADHLRDGIARVCRELGQVLGTTFSAGAFAASVALHARVRELVEAIQGDVAAGLVPFHELARLVDRWHACGPDAVASDLVACHERAALATPAPATLPVLVSGILPPDEVVLKAMERAGLRVVANDIASMHRGTARTPPFTADPGDYYIDHYLHHCPCTTLLHTANARLGYLLDLIRTSGTMGVVLAGEKFCEHESFEHPAVENACKAAGIPVLRIETGAGAGANGGALVPRVEAFAELLLAGGGSRP